jgi:hypothetical protein
LASDSGIQWILSGRLRESASNRSELDVREDDLRVRVGSLYLRGYTAVDVALAAGDTGLLRILVGRVAAVQPEHIGVVVVPEAHDKHHTQVHTPAHRGHAAELVEGVDFLLEDFLLCIAPFLGDGVACLCGC